MSIFLNIAVSLIKIIVELLIMVFKVNIEHELVILLFLLLSYLLYLGFLRLLLLYLLIWLNFGDRPTCFLFTTQFPA